MYRLIYCLLFVVMVSPAHAQSSEDYALMASTAYAAFACSTLVDKYERPEDRQSLLDLGYERGKTFLMAMEEGQVETEHVYRSVPLAFLDKLDPWAGAKLPSVDFRLGAVWERALTSIEQLLIESSGGPQFAAKIEFNKRNCGTLLAIARQELR